MLTILMKYWKPILIVLILVLVRSEGYYSGSKSVKTEWELANQRDLIYTKDNIINTERKYFAIGNEIDNGLQTSLTDIDTRYVNAADSLLPAPATEGVSETSNTPGQCPKTPSGNQLSRKTKEELVLLTKIADIQTQQLLACQEWIRKVSYEEEKETR